MENLRVINKEKLESIINAGKEARIYAARRLPIGVVCEMAVTEEDENVLDVIIKRLDVARDTKEIIDSCEKLSKAVDCRVREFVAGIAPIEVVCEMAVIEMDTGILKVIIKRLEDAKDKGELIGACRTLSKSYIWPVREFVAGIAPIEVVCEMAVSEGVDNVLEIIFERLEKEKHTEEVIGVCRKLSKGYWQVREFVAGIAPIEVVCEMAVTEEDNDVLDIIIERLEKAKHTEEVIGAYRKMSKGNWRVRKFVAGIAPIEVVCEMAATEENYNVLEIILERLEKEKHTEEVIGACQKLSKAEVWQVREFVAGIAPIEVVCEMAVIEEDDDVLDVIIKRFENAKDKNEIIGAYRKLSKGNWQVREFVAGIAPIEVVCEMAVTEKDNDVLVRIIKRLEAEMNTEEVLFAHEKLFRAKSLRIREIIVNKLPIKLLLKITVCKKNSDMIEIILKRLKPFKEIEEVGIIYDKMCKYSSKRKEYYKDMSDDELIEIVEAEGEGDILKLVDEMSN